MRARTAAALLVVSAFKALSLSAQAPPRVLADARELIVVVTPDWESTNGALRRYVREKAGTGWAAVEGEIPVVIGRTGLAWADSSLASSVTEAVKREGDGKSPAGAFPLDTAFGFATRSELPWMHMPYSSLTDGSDCVDDVASQYYNTVVDRARVPAVDWNSAEHMRSIAVYRLGVIVGYNASRPRKGRGSCIFLHIWGGPSSTTAGCTAMDAGALEAVVKWLDASRRPVIVQLPASEYARLRGSWALPAR